MNDIIYKLAAHAEALTDLARIRAAQAMLEARDEIVRLRADNARLSAAVLHADQWSSDCPCDERLCPRVEERPLVPPNWGGPCEYANVQVGSNLCVCGFPMVDHLEPGAFDRLAHSRACGFRKHDHGRDCHQNCPTCHGLPLPHEVSA